VEHCIVLMLKLHLLIHLLHFLTPRVPTGCYIDTDLWLWSNQKSQITYLWGLGHPISATVRAGQYLKIFVAQLLSKVIAQYYGIKFCLQQKKIN